MRFLVAKFINLFLDMKPKGTITREEIEVLVKDKFPNVQYYIMNPTYNLYSSEQYKRFYMADGTDQDIYTNKENCVIFSFKVFVNARMNLTSPAHGSLITDTHAVNWQITDKHEIEITESQTDEQIGITGRVFLLI